MKREKKGENKKREQIDEIKKYYKELKSIEEIAKIMGYSVSFIYNLIDYARKQGIWFTAEEEKEIKPKRKEQREKRKEKREQIEEIKRYYKELKSIKEIAKIMGYSVSSIYNLIVYARKQGIWFTEEEEKEIQAKREGKRENKKREEEIKPKGKGKEQRENKKRKQIEEIKRYYKELKSIEEIAEIMNYSKNNIYLLIGSARKQGIWFTEEEEKEIQAKRKAKNKKNSEEKVSTTAISEFLDILIKKFKSGETIPQEDIQKILNYYLSHSDRISKSGLKLLLLNSYRQRKERGLIKMVKELRRIISEPEMKKNLETYINALYILIMKQRIKELKKQGLNNTQIGEELRLSSAEIAELNAVPDPTVFSDFR